MREEIRGILEKFNIQSIIERGIWFEELSDSITG